MFHRIFLVFSDKELRTKILKIIGLLIVARLLTHIPLPGLNVQDLTGVLEDNAVFSLLDTISGGGYGSLSFVMLGISPYITASIVFQLLGVIVPKINQIKKEEGQQGQQKINRWTRMLTVPLAAMNAWGIMRYLANTPVSEGSSETILPEVFSSGGVDAAWAWASVIIALTAGSIIMMWIGEIITEFKMGNGISILILSGIVSKIPGGVSDQWDKLVDNVKVFGDKFEFGYIFDKDAWSHFFEEAEWTTLRSTLVLIFSFVVTLLFVVFINNAVRKLLVVYSRRGHSEGESRTLGNVKADLPIKVNVAGVIPIIFAVSFILFPSVIATFLSTSNLNDVTEKAQKVETFLSSERNPVEEPEQIQKNGVLGFYSVDSEEELLLAKRYDTTKGADLFGITINNFETDCDYQHSSSTDMTDEQIAQSELKTAYKDDINTEIFGIDIPCGKGLSFLPEFGFHWKGVSAYNFFYFFLVVFFTYFYTTTVAFKTEDVAENLQKSGAYVPGYKPGRETEEYLAYVSNRLNVVGSLFLAIIAIFPIIISRYIDFGGGGGGLTSVVGGTTLLILVSVAMETLRQIEAQATAVDYERFTKY